MKNFHTFQFFRKENCLISTAVSIAKMGWLFLIWSQSLKKAIFTLLSRSRPSDLCAELIGQSIYLKQWSKLCFILYSYTVAVLHYVLTSPHKMKSFTSEWCLAGQCWLCAKEGTLFSISNVLACPWTIFYFASVIHWSSNPVFTLLSFVKVMWNAAVHAEYLHDHSDYGFDVENVRFSWE